MTYTIRLTPPELRTKADEIDRNIEIVNQEVSEIKALVNRLRPTFLGETAAAFFKEYDSAIKDMEQWDGVAHSFAIDIRDTANRLQKADRSHY